MIISVNGYDEVKNYPVLFNTSELFMDNNRDIFYVKAVDGIGKYHINTYKFEQIENEQPLSPENFVTKQQFDDLNSKLDRMFQFFTSGQQSQTTQGGMNNEQLNSEQTAVAAQRPTKSR